MTLIKQFLKGLVFGSAVGAVGGLLFAPRSGNDTRKKLIDELDEAADLTLDLNNSLNHFKEALAETKETAAALIPEFQDSIQKDVQEFKFQAEPRITQIQEQVEKISTNLPELPEENLH